jgi:hypothetical protein
MPWTSEFSRIRKDFRRKYKDIARADSLAFKKAIKEKIPTWKERDKKIKRQRRYNENYPIF